MPTVSGVHGRGRLQRKGQIPALFAKDVGVPTTVQLSVYSLSADEAVLASKSVLLPCVGLASADADAGAVEVSVMTSTIPDLQGNTEDKWDDVQKYLVILTSHGMVVHGDDKSYVGNLGYSEILHRGIPIRFLQPFQPLTIM